MFAHHTWFAVSRRKLHISIAILYLTLFNKTGLQIHDIFKANATQTCKLFELVS